MTETKGTTTFPFRHILIKPVHINPQVIDRKDEILLKVLLEKCLAELNPPVIKSQWRTLKSLNKENRIEEKKKHFKDLDPSIKKHIDRCRTLRKSVFIGLNVVTKALERNRVGACLIEKDVSLPPVALQHIHQLSEENKVPLIQIEGLRSTFKNTNNFVCAALAFNKTIQEDDSSPFSIIYRFITQLRGDIEDKQSSTTKDEKETAKNEVKQPAEYVKWRTKLLNININEKSEPESNTNDNISELEAKEYKSTSKTDNFRSMQDNKISLKEERQLQYFPPSVYKMQSKPNKQRKVSKRIKNKVVLMKKKHQN